MANIIRSRWIRFTLAAGLSALTISSAFAQESVDRLYDRAKIHKMAQSIQKGSQVGFESLPAKGYKDGVSGLLKHLHLYPNPDYSFTDCNDEALYAGSDSGPGCVVSLKLAKKGSSGSLTDVGVRMEYGIAPGAKTFHSNNSAWAEGAIRGSGALEAEFE